MLKNMVALFTLLNLTDCRVCEASYLLGHLTSILDFNDGMRLVLTCVLADRLCVELSSFTI